MSKMTNAAERCGRIRLPKVRAGELSKHLFMMLVVAAMFVPFIMMLSIALKDKKQIVYDFFSFSGPYHWENYKAAFSAISPYLFNTVFMATCTTVLSVLLATLAGYAFAKLKFPLRKLLYGIIFIKMMLPGVANLIPSFTLAMKLGILDTYLPVILFGAGVNMPYWVFVMRTFIGMQPNDLFESMRLDGAGELRIYWHLTLPLLRPMIALMSMNIFIAVWNDFIWPLVTIPSQELRPLTVGIAVLSTQFPQETGMLAASYVLASVPLFIIFLFSMKQFVEGLSAGSIKL